MPPSDYIRTRKLSQEPSNSNESFFSKVVDSHPYFPNLSVSASDISSVKHAALVLVYSSLLLRSNGCQVDDEVEHKKKLMEFFDTNSGGTQESSAMSQLSCTKVTGGITNALFRVSGFQSITSLTAADFDSVLVRIFGAEGMIDRDIETSTYAALCNADIAYKYMGRFSNGRIEGWLDGYHPLQNQDLTDETTSLEIAKEMARLHCLFDVPEGELRDHHCGTELDVISVGLWDQLSSWMEQAKGYSEFKTAKDTERARALQLDKIEMEVQTIIQSFAATEEENDSGDSTASICGSSSKPNVVFCHNDLLLANIMKNKTTGHIQLIDFEYGGSNYAAFDMANHFNEYAGGTTTKENGVPDYTRFPNSERQTKFCVEYVKMTKRLESMKSDITDQADYNGGQKEMVIEEDEGIMNEAIQLLSHVQKFILVNHLYWGLWAVNQAAEEGCEEFDYLTYASNRFNEYYVKKSEWEEK
mmetsp:Transcript_36495/g.74459  ORF Transcript_36495/g.74459 Transcript_36495/m.74459 type:complete len:472 (+) Transcript_36495:48-1463(+)